MPDSNWHLFNRLCAYPTDPGSEAGMTHKSVGD
jgi:hypothetical protein